LQVLEQIYINECTSQTLESLIAPNFDNHILCVLWPTNAHNYLTNYHTATCFDTIASTRGSL